MSVTSIEWLMAEFAWGAREKVAQRALPFPMTSVRLFEFDDERVAAVVVENLNLALPTHFEQSLFNSAGCSWLGDHRQEFLVGQN